MTIDIPDQEVGKAFDEKLKTYKRNLKLPGFRPGKVPDNIIKQRFGGSIRGEVVEDLIQSSFKDACKENSIVPVSAPKVVDIKSPEGEPLVITIECEIDPQIDITGYKKLKVRPSPKKIKDSDVDAALEQTRERLATFIDAGRPAKKGDYVRLEYIKVTVDGEERTDITSPTQPVEIGTDNGLKEFHKGIIGHSAGETVHIIVKFPKDYAEGNVAGKTGEFSVKITSVQEKVLPEIDKEFLDKLGNIADEAALRDKIREDLEREEASRAKEEAHNKAIDALIKENHFEVPPARADQFIDYMHQEAMRYQRKGTPAPDRAVIAEHYREMAINSIKRQRIIDAVADKEQIKVSQEEVDAEIQRIASMYQQDFDTVKQAFRKNGTTIRIRSDIRERKTLDYLIGEYMPDSQKE